MGNYTLNDLDYAYFSTGKPRKALNDLRTKADLDIALSAARSIYPSDSINDALYKYYSVTVDAVNVLKKYGTDAHIYLPGASYPINGIQAGNYLDSAGTTIASVDNPVGLSLDALQAMTLGPELVTNGAFTTDTSGWALLGDGIATVSSSQLLLTRGASGTGTLYLGQPITTIVGKTYQVAADFIKGTATQGDLYISTGANSGVYAQTFKNLTGSMPLVFVATSTTTYVGLVISSGVTGAGITAGFDNISVREIPGIHATQATTANKPILRLNSGKYSWQFDGVNDSLSLSAPLFQMADDHCVIAGFKADIANKYIFTHSHTGTSTQCCSLRVDASGFPGVVWIDDAPANALLSGSVSCVGLNTVATAAKMGNAKRLRINGVQSGTTNNTVLSVGTTNNYSIGSLNNLSGNFTGSIYPVIAIKGTVSDADLLILERFVGQLSGVIL